jgi:Zn-dependent protease
MVKCYHCGDEVSENDIFQCSECGQNYCVLHKDPIDHECNIVRESLKLKQIQSPSSSYAEGPPDQYERQITSNDLTSTPVRGTTDGTFTWHHQERYVPENAFDPDSGIEFKGILFPHKSEFLHLLIGAALIFIIGLIGFYNPLLISLNLTWAIFMLAGFYTTAFLFHEFGHRQVAKHFGLQTKFRLLTFGMILTIIGLITGISTLILGTGALPILALPGAVVVLGLEKIDRKTGLCKAAGPIVNLIYGTILLIISFIIPRYLYPLNMFIGVAASLNFMLGLFNMIPIGILDGQNIFKWNKSLYLILVVSLLVLLIIAFANIYAPIQTSLYVPEEWNTTTG